MREEGCRGLGIPGRRGDPKAAAGSMHRDVNCRTSPLAGGTDGGRKRKKDAELRRRSHSKVEGLAGSFETNTCSRGKRQDASRTRRERMLPCAPKEEKISAWRGRRSVIKMVM